MAPKHMTTDQRLANANALVERAGRLEKDAFNSGRSGSLNANLFMAVTTRKNAARDYVRAGDNLRAVIQYGHAFALARVLDLIRKDDQRGILGLLRQYQKTDGRK